MRGYPKHLNTKEDYEYIRQNFPKECWLQDFENLLTDLQIFVFVKKLEDGEVGIEDATHKIDVTDNNGVEERLQYELQDNPHARLHQIGYTEAEVRAIIA